AGTGQRARPREVHVPESAPRLHARHAVARAFRARRPNVQLGLHPPRESARARRDPARRDRALGPRSDRCRARDGTAAHDHAAAAPDGALDLRDGRAGERRALSPARRLRARRACARRARGAVRVRASGGLRTCLERERSLRSERPVKSRAKPGAADDDARLVAGCRARAVELLKKNSTPARVLAASSNPKAERRGYTSIFGRDAAICALGMAVSGDRELERAAVAGLETLA